MLARSAKNPQTNDVTRHGVTDAPASVRQPLGLLQRSIGNQAVLRLPPSDMLARVHEVIHSPGAPLDGPTRAAMEPRFGHDFEGVRVHADPRAAEAARDVNADAFTVGSDIVFGRQRYDPGSRGGAALLAHELAHTIQQGHRRPARGEPLAVSRPSDAAEQQAGAAAHAVLSDTPAGILSPGVTAIARQEASGDLAFEGVAVKGSSAVPARDVPLPDMPEGLAPAMVAAIRQDAQTISEEVTNFFPNTILILAILTKYFEFDERLGPLDRMLRPHLDTLLITLDAHAFNPHTTALDQLWHVFDGRSSRETFQFFMQRSYSYREYSPGPALRGLFAHEARRADAMRTRVLRGDYASVDRELDEPWAQNRDDVAVELVTYLNDDTLRSMAASAPGRSLLDRLLFALTRGSLGGDEAKQAERVLKAKASNIPAADVDRQLLSGEMKIFPYRSTGFTVGGAAPLRARRLKDGRVWVNMPMNVRTNDTYERETSTLPLAAFTDAGIVLPENEIIGVRLYDQGRYGEDAPLKIGPALYLVQVSNESLTQTLTKIAEVVGLGAGLGVGLLVEAGVEATLAARILLWADRAAFALGTLGSAILEHRGWILRNLPFGYALIEIVEIVNSVVALYGFVRFVTAMPGLVGAFREQARNWKAWRAAAREAGAEERNAIKAVDPQVEGTVKGIDQVEQSFTAEQRSNVISIAGRERRGSDLTKASSSVGDLDAMRLKKAGSPPPEGPKPVAPAQAVPEVMEEPLKMASGMGQRPTPVVKAKPKALDSTLTPEASAGPSRGGGTTIENVAPPKTSGTTTASTASRQSAGGSKGGTTSGPKLLYEEESARLALRQQANKKEIARLERAQERQLAEAEQLEREASAIREASTPERSWAPSQKKLVKAAKEKGKAEKSAGDAAALRAENNSIFKELKNREGLRPGETTDDLARRWFTQEPGETLDDYARRMNARRTLVEDEATRPRAVAEQEATGPRAPAEEDPTRLVTMHDEVLASIRQRFKDLAQAEQDFVAAEKAAAAASNEWNNVKQGKAYSQLTSEELLKESVSIQKTKELAEARQAVRRVQFGVDRTGDIGEMIAAKYLADKGYTNIRPFKNASGHGIDLAADQGGKTYFFEVKASESSRAKPPTAREENIDRFVRESLNDFTSTSDDAKRLLQEIEAGKLKVEGFVIEVTDVSLLTYASKTPKLRKW